MLSFLHPWLLVLILDIEMILFIGGSEKKLLKILKTLNSYLMALIPAAPPTEKTCQ